MYNFLIPFFPKLTYQRHKRLVEFFQNPEEVWCASSTEIVRSGWDLETASEFIRWREGFNTAAALAVFEKEKIQPVSLDSSKYPRLLAEISDPPLVLYVRGTLPPAGQPCVGVVGTRRCTLYGRQVTEELSRELAKAGVCIVSGLALGVDGYAHAAALDARGATVAVLGSGVDRKTIQPTSHGELAEDIIQNGGAVISEYPPGFKPTKYSFPERNRIIAGLSLGVLVTEAPKESGALITAKCAIDYNREVFAVPHPITSALGDGGNTLIRLGAKLVTQAQDILDELHVQNVQNIVINNQILPNNPTEALILPHLSKEPVHVDTLAKLSQLESATLLGALTILEMQGKVTNIGGMMYIIRC